MSQKDHNFHFSFIFVSYLADAGHVLTPSGVDKLLTQQLFGYRCSCLLRSRLCVRIWNGKYTFLATYENREICRYFPRKSLRCKYASIGEWRMGRDAERDGTGSPHRPVPLRLVPSLERDRIRGGDSTPSCLSPSCPLPLHAVPSLSVLSRPSVTRQR